MTYFGFLVWFLVPPIAILLILAAYDRRLHIRLMPNLTAWPIERVIFAHILVALIYTTPWDNYLVATGVWWYDPALVTGITLGWVPIEEYTFFILQTLAVGLWYSFLARRIKPGHRLISDGATEKTKQPVSRYLSAALLGLIWIVSMSILISGWQPGIYLALILVWGLPPIMLQILFGADLLWHYRRLVVTVILTSTAYLSIIDTIAISAGTWTISPDKTIGILIGGVLPFEEFTFFLITNILIGFGMTLVLAKESQARVPPKLLARIATLTGLSGSRTSR